jgi:hypothetical protein
MATRKLRIDGPAGSIAIMTEATPDAASSNPYGYLSGLFFHTDLDYTGIPAKVSWGTAPFPGVARRFVEWNDSDKCGCYITTACVEYVGEPDNGKTLTTLRKFRDGYMLKNAELVPLVEQYYSTAPQYVAKLKSMPNNKQIFENFYYNYIITAVSEIETGKYTEALNIYKQLYLQAKTYAEA